MGKRCLFVSYSGALHKLVDGTVTDEDLAHGLFYFGCARDHVMDPGPPAEAKGCVLDERKCVDNGAPVHERLKAAVLKAEAEGRVLWRQEDERLRFNPQMFLNLLQDNDVPNLTVLASFLSGSLIYSELEQSLAVAEVPLRVVCTFMGP